MGNIACTNCGCSTTNHVDIGEGTYHCKKCGRHCVWFWLSGARYCTVCHKNLGWQF